MSAEGRANLKVQICNKALDLVWFDCEHMLKSVLGTNQY